ncbi:hypothetical protein DBT_0700 [Dissulfuribacter thermophilus]|uniref:Uncharacterized protein n=1 Tax=Dissulfuribacter thermophilus TaxID=1156395 RepID=A0A1B9F7J3_9BACT|nr:hypothetical protein DBT_0700 [Dissulfuribacter thermophilus]
MKAYLGIPNPEQQSRLGKSANPEGRQKGTKNRDWDSPKK